MSQLVVFYDDEPVDLKKRVELQQAPLPEAGQSRSVDGVVREALVYVQVSGETGPFLVPFGEYDEWSLRDRYNEAIRIMNTLGASSISCQTFREVARRRRMGLKFKNQGPAFEQERVENSGFDFHHSGAGSVARDPRPLRWSDEPGFAAAVSSVLDNQASKVEINIRSHQRYSVDGSLGLQLKKLGFDLGGGEHKTGATTLHISAEFPSRQPQRGWR
ncbi:hypothetical protein [Janibacter sp. GS2]|uniref:hypothetical protein n=1 Tax=Janibacter sp. GS2 TaxID=3442646 RepID=UPI003EBCF34A